MFSFQFKKTLEKLIKLTNLIKIDGEDLKK